MQETYYNKKDKRIMAFCLFVFRLTLDYMYYFILKNEYMNIAILSLGYAKGAFSFNADPLRILVSYILTIAFIEYVVKRIVNNDKPHELMVTSLLCLSILPNMTMFAYSEIEWRFIVLFSLFWGWFVVCVSMFDRTRLISDGFIIGFKSSVVDEKKSAAYVFWMIAVLFLVGSAVFSIVYNGGLRFNFDLTNDVVYENRLAARGSIDLLTNYFRNNAMFVIIPIIAIAFLLKRKYVMFILAIVVLLMLFSVDSLKIVIFLIVVSIIAAVIITTKVSKSIIKWLLTLNVFVILCYVLTGDILAIDYLVKRVYFLPAIIGNCFYEFVGENGNQVFFSSLLIRLGIITNYAYSEIQLPFLIGRYYFGSINISANTGGFGSAFAYGDYALILIPVLYAYMFRILDRVTCRIEPKYYISFIILNAYVITNASISTVIIVYGYVAGLILLMIMNRMEAFRYNNLRLPQLVLRGR